MFSDTDKGRSRSLVISLAAHAAAFAALMNAPSIRLPEREKSEYRLAIAGKEEKLVWYRFEKLPDVSPPVAKAERRRPRAENIAKQEIVASPKAAPKRKQVVWSPAPVLPDMPMLQSPNLLAVKMPARAFTAPPDIVKPKLVEVQPLPDAPVIDAQALSAVKLAEMPRMAKRFVAPPRMVPGKLKDVAMPVEAPELLAGAALPSSLDYKMKAPSRPFRAPPAPAAAGTAKPADPDAPPTVVNDVLSVAVVGLNPSVHPAPLPVASSPARFSAAPAVRNDGAEAAAADGKGLAVPDLSVRSPNDPRGDLKSELRALAYAAPTSSANLRESLRLGQNGGAVRVDPAPISRGAPLKVSGAPDPRFNGRDVYMMAIQMPNLTSYSGSWLMWYADRTAREAGLAPVSPPVAHRKVDPKYVAAAAADRIEGKVLLACVIGKDGRVSTVEIVKGLEDRLNASAVEAMGKWEFDPATRAGEPVSVDVLVEIPFRLEPRRPVAY